MGEEIITFGDIKIEKRNFTAIKFNLSEDVDINAIYLSSKISSGKKKL